MHIRTFGEGPPLVALHGFTLTGSQFRSLAEPLGRKIIAPDLPGHGGSQSDPTDFPAVVDAIVAHLESFEAPPPLLGYSQGGRIAIGAAASRPELISHLIVISASAGIDDDGERVARKVLDEDLASRIVEHGLDSFLAAWTSSGLTSTAARASEVRQSDLEVRRDNTADGLASAVRGYGQGSQPNFWDRLPAVLAPTLVIAGERDEKYREIAARLAGGVPNASLRIIHGSDHNPLLDQPEITAALVSGFLDGDR